MDKFDNCYDFCGEIVENYVELVTPPTYVEDVIILEDLTDNIKKMVIEEYDLLKSLSLDEVREFLNKISVLEVEDNDCALSRLKNKLIDHEQILLGSSIKGNRLCNLKEIRDMDFCLYDVIISMVNIDIMKSLKRKIDSVVPYCDSDENFIKLLHDRLEIAKFTFLYSTSTSEMLALYNNGNIDKVPRIDINVIKTAIKDLDLNKDMINASIAYFSRQIIDIFKDTVKIDRHKVTEVFNYLAVVTQFEILLSYMDYDMLETIDEYCSKVSDKNNMASMSYAKNLVKRRRNNLDELM